MGGIEIEVKDNLKGKAIRDINIPLEFMVVAIRRLNEVIIPEPDTVLKAKDVLMGVVKVANLNDIKERFGLS